MKIKICPACKQVCKPEDMICSHCLTPLDNVEAIEENKANDNEEKGPFALVNDAHKLYLNNGDIVGRDAKGAIIFENILTVSRRHAKFVCDELGCFVVDLNSTNGTYLNGEKIESEQEVAIKEGDEIGFSKRVLFKVVV